MFIIFLVIFIVLYFILDYATNTRNGKKIFLSVIWFLAISEMLNRFFSDILHPQVWIGDFCGFFAGILFMGLVTATTIYRYYVKHVGDK